jgi:ADP-heptose:LPS heptosyltransferase
MKIQTIGVLSGQEVIGDALIKLPFLRALRQAWPNAQIHWVTTRDKTAYSGPMRDTVRPFIDEIHEVPDWLAIRHAQEAPSFDLLIDTRGRWKLALEARWRLKHGLFIAPAFRFALSQRRPPLFSKRPKRLVNRLLQLVELASGAPPNVSSRLPISPEMWDKALKILPQGQVYIGLAPGAGNEIKKWPLPNFIALAQEIEAKGYKPVFLLGPQEQDIYEELRTAVAGALFPLQATGIWHAPPKVDHTLAIADCLTLAVTNDSGTSHMLAAVDCPLISLFGPTSAGKLAPEVTHGCVIKAQDFGGSYMESIPKECVIKSIENVIFLLENK